ncbi:MULTISPECIES: TetR family transcriptional regulator [unclassified Streptomyces]|uniref:TetR family transcriptional regulator n=1 Tax=unclassified Streptomyces TaxID=2593676 RepID=UPI0006F257C7|nr:MULTISPECIES: TetR family transcriptional regulator [unclassified Streptomyces]KQX47788.1 TetR family transcriptional regulator [Streptomyces sp. Root1304]KRA82180.1 TetR family transcriptional regulator [Streptomyces sp. Root66D1]
MVPVPQTRPQTPPVLRRAPVQQRSAERLARILDACAVLLDETGYEQLSTRAVAGRAGVPIGSVYRFFGNKRAMVAALAHRNLDEYARRISDRFAEAPFLDAHGAIDGVLDEFIAMKRTVPGFALVDFGVPAAAPGENSAGRDAEEPAGGREGRAGDATEGSGGSPAGSDLEDPNRLVAERICALLATHLSRPADDDLRRKVLVGVETADALVRLAFRTDPAGDPALVDETRQLLYAYLAPSLG